MNEAELGAKLRLLLEESGRSAWELSRRANVKSALVSAALRGSPSVPIAAWCRLARALDREVGLVPAPPCVRNVGPVESEVDVVVRRLGEWNRVFDELDSLARATFESTDVAAAWLRLPHPMLEGQSPLECAKSSGPGAQRVRDMLAAIKDGGVV